jgi:hypothetical protein
MLLREEKVALIQKAVNHNAHARNMASCNSFYMGSMATASLFDRLGADWPNVSLAFAMKRATEEQLDAAVEYCKPYWTAAQRIRT